MKILNRFILLVSMLFSGCAVTNSYGPYMGKVVEKDTGEPINGAVIFMRFYTEGLFMLSQFEDAVEVLTDDNGEFLIPPIRVFSRFPTPLAKWEPGNVIIFMPGYGVYPGHGESGPKFIPNGSIPENKPITIELPKLMTKEERGRNVGNALSFSTSVPYEKYKILFGAVNQERVFLGGKPYSIPGGSK